MDLERLEKLAVEATAACGTGLYHLEWKGPTGKKTLRVFIHRPEGVTVSDCERVSRHLGILLDAEGTISSRYTLEVSSPGIDRPLFRPDHFSACLGKELDVRSDPRDGKGLKKHVGRLVRVGPQGFALSLEDGTEKEFSFSSVVSARLKVKF